MLRAFGYAAEMSSPFAFTEHTTDLEVFALAGAALVIGYAPGLLYLRSRPRQWVAIGVLNFAAIVAADVGLALRGDTLPFPAVTAAILSALLIVLGLALWIGALVWSISVNGRVEKA